MAGYRGKREDEMGDYMSSSTAVETQCLRLGDWGTAGRRHDDTRARRHDDATARRDERKEGWEDEKTGKQENVM